MDAPSVVEHFRDLWSQARDSMDAQRVNRCAERGLGVIQCYGSVNGEVKIGQNDTEFFNHGWDRILTDEDGAGRGIGRIMAGQNSSRGGAQGVWVRFRSATRWMP